MGFEAELDVTLCSENVMLQMFFLPETFEPGVRLISHTSTMSSCRVDHYVIITMTLAAMMRNALCAIIVQLKVFAATWQK